MPAEEAVGLFCADYFSDFEVPSSADPRIKYRVSMGGISSVHCTCPAFEFWRGPEMERTCKHVTYVGKGMRRSLSRTSRQDDRLSAGWMR
jgi:hypothetical protein